MSVLALVSSVLMFTGCLLPWMQMGTLVVSRGLDNPDGAIALVAALVGGAAALYETATKRSRLGWLLLPVAAAGLAVAVLDLREVGTRVRTLEDAVGGAKGLVSVGAGLYVLLLGAAGMAVAGLGTSFTRRAAQAEHGGEEQRPSQSSETTECPCCAETIKRNARVCRYCGKELAARGGMSLPPVEPAKSESSTPSASRSLSTLEGMGYSVRNDKGKRWEVSHPGKGTRFFYSDQELAWFAEVEAGRRDRDSSKPANP